MIARKVFRLKPLELRASTPKLRYAPNLTAYDGLTGGASLTAKAGLKRNGNLLYTIRPIQLAPGQFYEQQLSTKVEYRLWIAQPSAKRSLHKSYIWFDNFALNPTA